MAKSGWLNYPACYWKTAISHKEGQSGSTPECGTNFLKYNTMEKWDKELVIELAKIFDENKGHITCEVSVHEDNITEFQKFVDEFATPKCGYWFINECKACVGYHGEGYQHAELMRNS